MQILFLNASCLCHLFYAIDTIKKLTFSSALEDASSTERKRKRLSDLHFSVAKPATQLLPWPMAVSILETYNASGRL